MNFLCGANNSFLKSMSLASCDLGFPKNGLCWVWASGNSYQSNPFGRWRAPTESEWVEKPTWRELENHCHPDRFGGTKCDIAFAKKTGKICFCRAKGQCNGQNRHCDLMYVAPAEYEISEKGSKKLSGVFFVKIKSHLHIKFNSNAL